MPAASGDPLHHFNVPETTLRWRLASALAKPMLPVQRSLHWAWALQHRERRRLQSEMAQIRGLMPLLMKQRNGVRWTETDRRKIRAQLRKLAALSPYMILFVSPGGFFVIPVLAWWLDRRRQRRANQGSQTSGD